MKTAGMARRSLLAGLAVGSVAFAAPIVVRASEKKIVVPLATWGSPTHINLTSFVSALEAALQEESGGRVTLRHYPAGQLAQDVDMPIAIPTGKVKFGWITLSNWSGLVKDVGALSLPTAMSIEAAAKLSDQPGGLKEVLDRQFQAKGAKLLAMTDLGSPAIVSSKRIALPDDMKGLRVRAPSEGYAKFILQLGGAPVAIPFAETYTALQHGTIDAAVVGFPGIASQRLYEICKFAIVPGSFTGMSMMAFAANLAWWNSFDAEDQAILSKAIRRAEIASRAAIIKDRAGLADQYRAEGMEVIMLDESMPEFPAWKEATAPLLQRASEFSKEIMAPFQAASVSQ